MNSPQLDSSENSPIQISTWRTAENLQQLIEAAPVAIVTVDQRGIILYVNQKLEELFGYGRVELIGSPVELLLPEGVRTRHVQHRMHYNADDPHVRPMGSGMNLVGRRKDESEFPLEAGLSSVQIGDARLVVASIVDITVRKQIEEMLEQRVQERTTELERRRFVADGLRDILAMLNTDQSLGETLDYMVMHAGMLFDADACVIFRTDEKAAKVHVKASKGIPNDYLTQGEIPLNQESFVGHAILNRQPVTISDIASTLPNASSEVLRRRQLLLENGYQAFLIVPLLIKGDIYGTLSLYYAAQRDFSPEEIDLATTFGDQAGLVIENVRLRIQSEESAVAAERSRIARDLHDSVTQTLFSANIIADILPRLWDRDEAQGRQRLSELHDLTRGALAEMRTMLLELRPAMLTTAALDEVLQQLVDATTTRARLPVTLEIKGDCNSLPTEVRIPLYRIAQEALNNVAKHAQATTAAVRMYCLSDRVDLMIRDDGIGFVVEQITGDHQGLTIMTERADEIDATLTIDTRPGEGTVITVERSNSWNNSHKEIST